MHRHLICLAAVLIIALGSFTVGRAEILGDYLSVKACTECHEEEVAGWKTTPHAHAFETLKEQGEEKQSAQGCVKCHVVGFEKDGGFIDMELTPELKDVQCEACHGPGRLHAGSEDPADIVGKPDAKLCRSCHTEGQDKNFDYETKKMWVHGGSGESAKVAAVSQPVMGNLTISQRQVEFGHMIEGEVAKKNVRLSNTGKARLKVTNVTTSWACTTTALGQRELKPGESTNLTIIYNTFKFPGKFEKFVTVFTDITSQKESRIDITGFVKAIPMGVLEVAPRKVSAGEIKVGSPATFEIGVKNTGNADMVLTQVVSKKHGTVYFDAGTAGEMIIRAGETKTVPIEIVAKKQGRYLDYVMIHSNARNVTKKGYKVVVVAIAL